MKYRKKPVVIEAIQLTKHNGYEILKWMQDNGTTLDNSNITPNGVLIPTLEGLMLGGIGDYIIKGINGEFYPCKPDIFKKTYEVVEE